MTVSRPRMSLFSPSGGLVYHGRALLYRDSLWSTFRQQVRIWLEEQLPPDDELILIGPSAGHCLPLDHLRRFAKLLALEPDPAARFWLAARLRPTRVHFEARDLVLAPLLTGRRGLEPLLQARPRAAVLFCNVLGQLSFGLPDERYEHFAAGFRERVLPLLAGRRWASFHDRWSLTEAPPGLGPEARSFDHLPSDEELGAAWFSPHTSPVTVVEHRTEQLFPAEWPRRYFAWQLRPDVLHLVEGVSGAAGQLGSAS